LALLLGVMAVGLPRPPQVQRTRLDVARREATAAPVTARGRVTAQADRLLRRLGRTEALETALERAGMHRRPADVVVLTAAIACPLAVAGIALSGSVAGLLLAVVAPLGAVALVVVRRSRRQKAFADQLDDVVQLMASSLRAGHSVLRAVDAVSRDTDAPAAEEFSRVVNETRVGRDVTSALEEVADRTGSQDFGWVVQAIAIHREVGGNLAEVLDRVGATVRERSQLRRQVSSLSAEGRLSAVVLLAMPVVILGVMAMTAPEYVARLTGTGSGIGLIVGAGLLVLIGALWLRIAVRVRF
ncbi:MAG: Type secretion system domain protein, partial [Modestobacter sp.]|nr:Type secretion system domain protein [Modestobacter sp.]